MNVFPYPCLYLLYCEEEEEEEDDDEDIEDEGSPVEKITEFRFIPLSSDSCEFSLHLCNLICKYF